MTLPQATLRSEAERRLRAMASSSPLETSVHELMVHQIELEIQNEQLRQTQIELEQLRDRYLELFDFAPVGYVTMSLTGVIDEVNLAFALMLDSGKHSFPARDFADLVCAEDADQWRQGLLQLRLDCHRHSLKLALQRQDNAPVFVRFDMQRSAGALSKSLRAVAVVISEADYLAGKKAMNG